MFDRIRFLGGLGAVLNNALLLYFLSSPAFGQFSLLYQKDGAAIGDGLGMSVAGTGDVNGDGVPDYIIGIPLADPSGLSAAGTAQIYSGASGALLYKKDGIVANDWFGTRVAGAGDVNGDGRSDFIVGSRTQAFVFSGANGNLLYQKSGGGPVAGAGDVDGDGRADFLAGMPGADPNGLTDAGSALLYSGATGLLLYQKSGTASGDNFGNAMAGVGDVNGDGRADFIVGAYSADPGGLTNAGSVYVYSGATGALLYQKNGASAYDLFGNSVAGGDDVNGDGRPDFIIGARLADVGGVTDAGSALVYSGATGNLLYQKNGTAIGQAVGQSVAITGDVDGDGRADFLVGTIDADPNGLLDAGSVFLYSGTTGTLLFQINGTAAYDNLGAAVAGVGDLNHNGGAEFIIGAPYADPNGLASSGSAFLYGSGTTGVDPCNPDVTLPTLTCATDKRIACGAKVIFDQPAAADNCTTSPVISIVSTTQASGPGPGEVTYTRTWKATDNSGNVSSPCSQKITASACSRSQITQPTAACADFNSGSSVDLTQVCYTVKNGRISKTLPSAFYYYVAVTAPSSSFTVDVFQTNYDEVFPRFQVARNGVSLYDGSCIKIGTGTSNAPGQAQVSVSGATVGQLYIVSVRYSTSAAVGRFVGASRPQLHYDFAAYVNSAEISRDPDGVNFINCSGSSLAAELGAAPAELELQGNYPNPFNATTSIRFSIPQDALVRLDIYNMLGQKVRTLADETKAAGEHTVIWDGRDNAGNTVATGIYFYRITVEDEYKVGRMIFLK